MKFHDISPLSAPSGKLFWPSLENSIIVHTGKILPTLMHLMW